MANTPVLVQGISDAAAAQSGSITQLYKVAAPFTTVVNRALMTDLSRDLLPRMGVNRIMTQQIEEVLGEFGPGGERVWKVPNDVHDQIRFIGDWQSNTGISGQQVSPTGNGASLSVEISFYGTGLNILTRNYLTYAMSVDGGASSNVTIPTFSLVLDARGYNQNTVVNLVSGLTLGFHTVKLTDTTFGSRLLGFEIVNQSGTSPNTLQLLPGSSYAGGKKNSAAALTVDSYNSNFQSGTLGVNGGHVLVYHSSSGQVQKAVTPAGTSPLYLSSANHANESLIRTYNPREFGAGSVVSTDFSTVGTTATDAFFTLDDGSTCMVGHNIQFGVIATNGVDYTGTNGNFLAITFVGTGLDVELQSDGSTRTIDAISVDADSGSSVGSISLIANLHQTYKIVSGLPYGSHTVLFTSTGSVSPAFMKFHVYGPSTPTLPSNAVQVADYYVMANYINQGAQAQQNFMGTGTLFKSPLREVLYSGTWTIVASNTHATGAYVSSSTNGNSWSYTFYGTGIEVLASYGTAATATVSLDGSAPLAGNVTVNGGTYASPTWTLTGGNGSRFILTGLTLGLHTVTFTIASNTGGVFVFGHAIITPIHSPKSNLPGDLQGALAVGSQSLGDSRLFGSNVSKPLNNWAQAVGITAGPSTTTTGVVPLPDMTCVIKTSGNPIYVTLSAEFSGSAASTLASTIIAVDGVLFGSEKDANVGTAVQQTISDSLIVPVSAGVHVVQVMWGTNTGTVTAVGTRRNLTVREIGT